jgi:outer membrane immunogenic protein
MNLRALAFAAALIVSPSVASADGLPPPPPPAVAAYCCEQALPVWTGFYIGTNIGGAWSDPSWRFPFVEAFNTPPGGQSFSPSASGWIWGGQLGLNYQIHHFLIGAEASYAGNRLRDTVTGPLAASPTDQFVIGAADLFTATGRIGVIAFHNQFLFYGKGGYASSLVEVQALSSTGITARASQRENGWVVGAGLESRMVSNVIFGLEYNYVSLAGDRFTGVTGGTGPAGPFNFDIINLQMHTFTARLSVLFGPHACCSEGLIGKY